MLPSLSKLRVRKPRGPQPNRCRPVVESLEDRTVPSEVNIAFNPAAADFPHPLESDHGWGGGSNQWDILDGREDYPEWYHGLAFTGGRLDYVEPAGPRQATIDFGQDQTFHEVILWHHGLNHIPADTALDYWDGEQWNSIGFYRFVDVGYQSQGAGATPDYYFFANVTGSKIRYSFDNRLLDYQGDQQIEHGWLYEFEVYSTVDEGAGLAAGDGRTAGASANLSARAADQVVHALAPARTEVSPAQVPADVTGLRPATGTIHSRNEAAPASPKAGVSTAHQAGAAPAQGVFLDLLGESPEFLLVETGPAM